MIIDQIHLVVQAGSGGNGCASFFVRKDRKKIPNGGDGGRGGSVIFSASHNATSLDGLKYKQHLIAESGANGGSNRKRGKNGEDLKILVPVGTRIRDRERNFLIRELAQDGEEVVVCQGGRGGSGNQGDKEATPGQKGVVLDIELSIRILADVFLIGLPNSGKSSILNVLTRVQTKEESYPFATKAPVIGVYELSEYQHMTLCELPSLYRSSHEGRGLGVDYLKHLEKAPYILYVLNPFSQFAGSIQEGLDILKEEVARYQASFAGISYSVIINKVDEEGARERIDGEKFDPGVPVICLSTKTGEGMELFKEHLSYIRQKKSG
ncbi:MAG: 50S ribosome-binding GTPase [Candidatus Omnitrophica bacterium]|nr:50S ribosome-binding GTPase [Candidatus Omnitrophota bacterium]